MLNAGPRVTDLAFSLGGEIGQTTLKKQRDSVQE